ncbi:cupin domain-containing protein [Flammeovirga pectinis]|uniref:Cupin domain-containing protein n=1 Tax=Flammeovirga pectinis TaxID=2494373 RepID=A0A3Q9FQQ7_9BACT|nr:cupin domain-containing protein [Flammeovirga pectinis]AZQ63845.1 cupin domain-containing protein [Flammeovirga pectinis]
MELKKLVKSGEGENYDYSQDHCFIKVSSKDTNGELCFVEDSLKPGFHLKRHQHKIMTEVFYMLEGEMELIFDDETVLLKVGDTITVPPNVWHEAKCVKGGKMLSIFKDGQFDIFLEELSKMNDAQFADKEFMDAFSAKFDIYEQEL